VDDGEGEGVAVVAQRKFAPKPTAKQLAENDRVMRARRANPPRDPDGTCHEALSELARETGRDVCDLLDDWDEQAALLEYEGNVTRHDAESRAVRMIIERVTRQTRLL
jgi:hypothetical protein